VEYIVKSGSPQYVFDRRAAAAQLHEVLSVPYQAAVLRDGNILKFQAPNPLPPGRKLGDPRFFGVLTATGGAAGGHDGAPAEGRDRIPSDGSVTDAYDPSDDEGH